MPDIVSNPDQPDLTMEARAAALLDNVRETMSAPLLTKMNALPELVEDMGHFMLELARAVDMLTPYSDEVAE